MRILLASMLLLIPTLSRAIETREEMVEIWNEFFTLPLDTGTIYAADGFQLRKDAMTFHFESGDFFLQEPVKGDVTGAFFVGRGRAKMTPPVAMERKQLAKFVESESLDIEFTELYLRFNDDTGEWIGKLPTGETGDLPMPIDRIASRFSEQMQQISRFLFLNLRMDYLETRISGLRGRDFFLAGLKTEQYTNVGFLFSDIQNREVYLGHRTRVGSQWQVFTWSSFHKASDYNEKERYVANLEADSKEILDIEHYDMKIDIQNLKTLELDARIRLASRVDGLRGVRLQFLNNLDFINWQSGGLPLTVTALTDDEGNPLPYIHKKHELMFILPRALSRGEQFTFRIQSREDTIQQATVESFSLLNTYPWYPWYGYLGGRFTFEWEVRVPKPYHATGSGVMVREWEEKDENCSVWKSNTPVHLPSLLFGRFQRETVVYTNPENDRKVRINVHSFPIITFPSGAEIKVPITKAQDMLNEAKQILTLFEDIYGPFPYRELDIAQMSPGFGFGQAPPGLVQLTGEAFMSATRMESDFIHGFLSHEIAHQWWANQVGWFDEEDEWISESFAEYAAGIFVQQYQGENRFQQKLKEWRQNAKVSDGVAPIAAANRVSGDNAGRDRTNLVYNKGPYVLHMLRSQIGDDNYRKSMTAVNEKYGHMNIKTEHIQREVERVVGYGMGWFFDQWFRETGIPEIRFEYSMRPSEDGKVLFTAFFRQDPAEFKRFLGLPVSFQFGKNQVAIQKVMIREPNQKFQVKLPMKPKKVEVNADNRYLAEIIYEKSGK